MIMMRLRFPERLLACHLVLFAAGTAGAASSYDILKMADEARGNVEGISWEVVVESVEGGHSDTMVYDIKARGFSIAGTSLAPPKHRGNKLLMQDNNMWFYKPGLSKPIPISQRQKLMGNAAYGDIASTNYADDYEATPLPDETVEGVDCHVFDLKARNPRATYDRIRYWISKDTRVGVKAEYFTLSGKKIKSANMQYGNSVRIAGAARPFISQIAIHEALMSGDVTTLSMTKPRLAPLPDYVFNLNLFMR
jgi:outer membrane lipoprotein-sorting protein